MDIHQQPLIRVVLADRLAISRMGLKCWLEQEPDIKVIAEAVTGEDLLDVVQSRRPEVVVLSYTLPVKSAIDIVNVLKKEKITSKVVVIGVGYDSYATKVISAGVDGFMLQDEKREVFVTAVRQVVQDGAVHWLSPSARKEQFEITQELKLRGVTPMEKKILTIIDHDNSTIAAMLHLAEGTVRNHISNIYLRLDVAGRKEAIQSARRLGLLDC